MATLFRTFLGTTPSIALRAYLDRCRDSLLRVLFVYWSGALRERCIADGPTVYFLKWKNDEAG